METMRKYHIMIAALIVLCDRMTKWLVAQKITLHDSIDIVPGMFRLTHVQNQGAAFGLFAESPSEWRVAATARAGDTIPRSGPARIT